MLSKKPDRLSRGAAYQPTLELDKNREGLEEEEKSLVRKIDLFLLPSIWVMYLLSYLNRTK